MTKEKPKQKVKKISKQDKEVTKTLFVLLLPTIVIAAIAISAARVDIALLIVGLVIYQWVLVKQFAERFHGGF